MEFDFNSFLAGANRDILISKLEATVASHQEGLERMRGTAEQATNLAEVCLEEMTKDGHQPLTSATMSAYMGAFRMEATVLRDLGRQEMELAIMEFCLNRLRDGWFPPSDEAA